MNVLTITITIVMAIVAFGLGFIAARLFYRKSPIGVLRIDESDPYDGPYLFLELDSKPDSFKNKKQVTLNVKAENYVSQK